LQATIIGYKKRYYREYTHRLLGRLTGLIYVIPLLVFLKTGAIPRRKTPLYLGVGLLFALQGLLVGTWLKAA